MSIKSVLSKTLRFLLFGVLTLFLFHFGREPINSIFSWIIITVYLVSVDLLFSGYRGWKSISFYLINIGIAFVITHLDISIWFATLLVILYYLAFKWSTKTEE